MKALTQLRIARVLMVIAVVLLLGIESPWRGGLVGFTLVGLLNLTDAIAELKAREMKREIASRLASDLRDWARFNHFT